jgi:hypothetical protein
LTYGLNCSVVGLGIEIAGKDFFDVTGDGVKEAFVRVGCQGSTESWPNQVNVYDGSSNVGHPKLIGVLAKINDKARHRISKVSRVGSVVTVMTDEWSPVASGCCSDIVTQQRFTWHGSGFDAAPRTESPKFPGVASCSTSVSVGADTSCPFALNVESAWHLGGDGTAPFDVTSPVTKQSYSMQCVAGVPTVCRGGNKAVVYIR